MYLKKKQVTNISTHKILIVQVKLNGLNHQNMIPVYLFLASTFVLSLAIICAYLLLRHLRTDLNY